MVSGVGAVLWPDCGILRHIPSHGTPSGRGTTRFLSLAGVLQGPRPDNFALDGMVRFSLAWVTSPFRRVFSERTWFLFFFRPRFSGGTVSVAFFCLGEQTIGIKPTLVLPAQRPLFAYVRVHLGVCNRVLGLGLGQTGTPGGSLDCSPAFIFIGSIAIGLSARASDQLDRLRPVAVLSAQSSPKAVYRPLYGWDLFSTPPSLPPSLKRFFLPLTPLPRSSPNSFLQSYPAIPASEPPSVLHPNGCKGDSDAMRVHRQTMPRFSCSGKESSQPRRWGQSYGLSGGRWAHSVCPDVHGPSEGQSHLSLFRQRTVSRPHVLLLLEYLVSLVPT